MSGFFVPENEARWAVQVLYRIKRKNWGYNTYVLMLIPHLHGQAGRDLQRPEQRPDTKTPRYEAGCY